MHRPPSRRHHAALAVIVILVPPLAARDAAAAVEEVVWYRPPVEAPVVDPYRPPVTRYGPGNRGLTYDPAPGTGVRVAGPGRVVFAGAVADTLHVTVQHADGLRSSYSYLTSIGVRVGQTLGRGDTIGATGPGFHFGVRRGDDYVDPAGIFGRVSVTVRLVPHDERAAPTPAALRREHAALRALVVERDRNVAERFAAAWDAVLEAGADAAAGAWDAAVLLDELLDDLRPDRLTADIVATLWARHRADCTSPVQVAQVAGARRTPTTGARRDRRRVALLVGGLGSSSTDAAIDDVDLDGLGYATGDSIRFSYGNGRVPTRPGQPIAADLDGLPPAPYGPADTNGDVRARGAALADLLEATAAAAPDATIDLYAHSLGGLVTRYALLELAHRPGGLDPLGQVVTIGTPHQGADLATLASAAGDEVHLVADRVAAVFGVGIDADGTAVRQLAEHSEVIAELAARGVPGGVDFRTIGARGDLVVTADKASVPGHPSATVDLMGADAHDALPGAAAVTDELALGLEGLAPACEAFVDAVLDTIVPRSYVAATDTLSLQLLLSPLGRRA